MSDVAILVVAHPAFRREGDEALFVVVPSRTVRILDARVELQSLVGSAWTSVSSFDALPLDPPTPCAWTAHDLRGDRLRFTTRTIVETGRSERCEGDCGLVIRPPVWRKR